MQNGPLKPIRLKIVGLKNAGLKNAPLRSAPLRNVALKRALTVLLVTINIAVLPLFADEKPGLRVITPEQLPNFTFENQIRHPAPVIEELSLSQQFILGSQRQEIEDLIAGKLGIPGLKGTLDDLKTIQRLVDKDLIPLTDIKHWQSLGIVFGDLLAEELDLHWVSYKDELGESKALQWKKTMNFVFPVTVFSKRNQFGKPVDVQEIFLKIKKEVEGFRVSENRLQRFKNPDDKAS